MNKLAAKIRGLEEAFSGSNYQFSYQERYNDMVKAIIFSACSGYEVNLKNIERIVKDSLGTVKWKLTEERLKTLVTLKKLGSDIGMYTDYPRKEKRSKEGYYQAYSNLRKMDKDGEI